MAFFNELAKAIPIQKLWASEEEGNVENSTNSAVSEKCANVGYQKIKFVGQKSSEKKYLDNYEAGVVENKILIEIELQLDAFKTESLRTSTQILDFLGDIGGFYQALDLIIFMAAEYFSARFFLASIASSLYMFKDSERQKSIKKKIQHELQKKMSEVKLKNDDLSDELAEGGQICSALQVGKQAISSDSQKKENKFKNLLADIEREYKPIKINSLNLIFDPLLILCMTPLRRCCRHQSAYSRSTILQQCEDKFSDELEITNLLTKIRDTYDMTRHLHNSK